jgi:IS30 family transposase
MTIASMRQQGSSARAIARTLGRSAATVSRELARNACPTVGHASAPAQARYTSRREAARPRAKLHVQSVTWSVVLTLLEWKWSPQQISGTLKRVWPNDPTLHVSHETIYTAIYAQPRGELRRQLIATAMPQEILETKILPQIPVGRPGQPAEVAALVLYLCSREAAFVTGANIAINGGQHLQ